MIPNIPPKVFSLSAVAFGYLLIDDMTANEQNAVGNWLMLVAQVLSTNAFYRQVMQERGLESSGSRESDRQNNYKTNDYKDNDSNESEYAIRMLEKMIRAMQEEINQIKKEL